MKPPEEIKREFVRRWRQKANEMDPVEAMEMLVSKNKETQVNGQFLLSIG